MDMMFNTRKDLLAKNKAVFSLSYYTVLPNYSNVFNMPYQICKRNSFVLSSWSY